MGNIVGSLFGGDQADAAESAADAQYRSTLVATKTQKEIAEKQIKYLTESRDLARGDLQPYRAAGNEMLPGLSSLITDPQAQKDFILKNPFFASLAERSTNTLLNNQAAKGKVGSGGTAEALQNSLLLLGNDLLQGSINNRYNVASLGENAAAGSGNAAVSTGQSISSALGNSANQISSLITQGGNAAASGIMGAANARAAGASNLLSTGLSIAGLFL